MVPLVKVASLESELKQTKETYSTALTKLILRVKKLEKQIQTTNSRRKTRIVLSEDENAAEDPSNQGRIIKEIDADTNITLFTPTKVSNQSDQSKDHLRVLSASKVLIEAANKEHVLLLLKLTPEEEEVLVLAVVELVIPVNQTVLLMERLKTKEKKLCKNLSLQRNSRRGFKKLDAREEVLAEATQAIQTHEIDWNDPSVLRYHAQLNRPYSVAKVRKNMIMYLKNQGGYKMCYFKDSEKESKEKDEERMKRKTLKAREDKIKRQKTKDDPEKLTLMEYLQVVSDSEEAINVIPLAVKSLIVSWKSYCKGDIGFYEIHRADGSYKTYKFFSEMLNDFDKDDLIVLYRLFNEKYASIRPGFDDLMLRGDMKIMFDPDENVSLDLSRLATTLNRLERSIQTGIYSKLLAIRQSS
ncbi:hypothetical protein Tco_1045042 [Tanacetum coccineum]|uniref:Uncharacterized protein n=1 Tax=Tanacetum coccineum TaxID=301880 RepID=A0ABQ5GRM2_9ASTR